MIEIRQTARSSMVSTVLLLALAFGCATPPGGRELEAYRPDADPSVVQLPEIEQAPVSAAIVRLLRNGDRLSVSLRGIPNPEDLQVEVDESGCITLPLIGPIKVTGQTSSAAERTIEKEFVEGGYYRRITVIVVAEEDFYFVQGEVKSPGRFPLAGDMTLLQAIAAAGGYTDYAKPSKVRIMRGDEILYFNVERITRRRDPDPFLKRGDIVVVERRIFL
jgi:polysaccharide export outer membrane protein